jgi:hypothetical protein
MSAPEMPQSVKPPQLGIYAYVALSSPYVSQLFVKQKLFTDSRDDRARIEEWRSDCRPSIDFAASLVPVYARWSC